MKSKKVLPCPPAGAGANVDFHDGDERSVEDWEDEELVKLSIKIFKFKFLCQVCIMGVGNFYKLSNINIMRPWLKIMWASSDTMFWKGL